MEATEPIEYIQPNLREVAINTVMGCLLQQIEYEGRVLPVIDGEARTKCINKLVELIEGYEINGED